MSREPLSRQPPPGSGHETPERLYERLFGPILIVGGPDSQPDRRVVLAVIWATVDRERLVADLGLPAEILADDQLLGAWAVLVRPTDGDPIAVLEPLTEGRLAATLARRGEGPAGEYVEAPVPLEAIGAAAAAAGLAVSRPTDGPFGRSILVLSSPVGGPHLVLVERPAGTIGR